MVGFPRWSEYIVEVSILISKAIASSECLSLLADRSVDLVLYLFNFADIDLFKLVV